MARQVGGGQFLITTSPSLINCPKCARPVMAGTVRGLDEHVDTAMLNQLGELMALLEGRATFNLRGDVLSHRNQERIRGGRRDAPVLARHACKDTPEQHLDPAWVEAATAVVVQACGGVVVGNDKITQDPPF